MAIIFIGGSSMTSMFITAAPIGAVPKWLDPCEPTFIQSDILQRLLDTSDGDQIIEKLQSDGWELVSPGGLLIQFGHGHPVSDDLLEQLSDPPTARAAIETAGWRQRGKIWHPPDPSISETIVVPREWLDEISSVDLARRLVLQLTTYGWIATDNGDLIWEHTKLHSFLPPILIDAIRVESPSVLEKMRTAGWKICGTGYWQPGKARSPHLPITTTSIVAESLRSLEEGAAIVHLHTRELADRTNVYIPWLGTITVGTQRNQIVSNQYDVIVPAIRENNAAAILNLSTSVRGNREGARSELRRAHLKPYGNGKAPELA
ncbi:3-keto-5-aminohexanoate cleavage protein [Burkholderia sp. MS455]|uniref:3-keto-5-aminohexanoate cleavage protein n=1 Tax=Burkholderia sp. MS455 TaxID=2811788 RepID=UPI001EF4D0F8|nr:3-keto-5-aminohexanoate cleavage protein [Burkholderia sp. MS455]